jgi:hypothetical protein
MDLVIATVSSIVMVFVALFLGVIYLFLLRKLSARFQWRVGPMVSMYSDLAPLLGRSRILQPLYDAFHLSGRPLPYVSSKNDPFRTRVDTISSDLKDFRDAVFLGAPQHDHRHMGIFTDGGKLFLGFGSFSRIGRLDNIRSKLKAGIQECVVAVEGLPLPRVVVVGPPAPRRS